MTSLDLWFREVLFSVMPRQPERVLTKGHRISCHFSEVGTTLALSERRSI